MTKSFSGPGSTGFAGTSVALITPFKNGRPDLDKYAELVERQIVGGIDHIVPVGTTGESATLSHEEHRDVIKCAVDVARGRAGVIAGAGSNSTKEAISLSEFSAKVGADGLLQVTPYYNKPSQEGLYAHFKEVAQSAGLPVVLYNVPGRTSREIGVETIRRLYEDVDEIVALKEAGGSVDRVSSIIGTCEITVLSGDDSLALPMIAVGAKGLISVVANLFPENTSAMVSAAMKGDMEKARALHYKLLPVVRELFRENNPAGVKAAASIMGLADGKMRLPLCDIIPANEVLMRKALEEYVGRSL